MGLKSGSASVWVAGFLSVLIAYAGPLLIFIQAAQVGRIWRFGGTRSAAFAFDLQ